MIPRSTAPLAALGLLLSGCFSHSLHDSIRAAGYDIDNGPDSALVRGLGSGRLLRCPRVAPSIWRIETPSDTFWLHVPRTPDGLALLCDAAPDDSNHVVVPTDPYALRSCQDQTLDRGRPWDPSLALELVVSTRLDPFRPVDSAGVPRRARLLLAPGRRTDSVWIARERAILHLSRDGIAFQVPVELRTTRRRLERRSALAARRRPLYALTVPLDLLTSPVQVPVLLVRAGIDAFVLLGLSHRW